MIVMNIIFLLQVCTCGDIYQLSYWGAAGKKVSRIVFVRRGATCWHQEEIKNNAWVTVNNNFFGHEWGDLPMIFTSDEVTSENHWQITSWVTKKIVIHGNECIILFLTCCFIFWTYRSAANNDRSLISPLSLGTVITVDLWRHMNARHWHCDVIFVDCSCTCKLPQRQSSLVNNNLEYRVFTTRYSRLSV